MEELIGKIARICKDYAKDGLKKGDLVEILAQWEKDLIPGNSSPERITKIMVRSLAHPYVVKEVDRMDVALEVNK